MNSERHDILNGVDLYYNQYKARAFENYELVSEFFPDLTNVIKEFFDAQQRTFKNFGWMIQSSFSDQNGTKKILFSAYFKNMYSLFTATELVLKGFHGSGRIVLRQVFEFLVIAKYSSVSKNEKFINHWEKGGQIGIGKQVFNKIKVKGQEKLDLLWIHLCDFNHATSFSQQIGVKFEDIKDDMLGDLALIIVLLNCNRHLLEQHLIDKRMKYHGDFYFSELKKELYRNSKAMAKESQKYLTKHSLQLIRAYLSKWEIK